MILLKICLITVLVIMLLELIFWVLGLGVSLKDADRKSIKFFFWNILIKIYELVIIILLYIHQRGNV